MSGEHVTTPAIVIEVGKGTPPTAYYAAVWHEPKPGGGTKPAKKRIGKAWLDYAGTDDDGRAVWVKRKGRVADGFFDDRRAHAAAPDVVRAWRDLQAAKALPADPADGLTIRKLAAEWLEWFVEVKGGAPSTAAGYRNMLRDPEPYGKDGSRLRAGRLMGEFGDRDPKTVTVRQVADWLRKLDRDGLSARSVNLHRQLLRNLYVYASREDTYDLAHNPVERTDPRRTPPPARLDFFEIEEVEALARAATAGAHRAPRGRQRSQHKGLDSPAARRQPSDHRL